MNWTGVDRVHSVQFGRIQLVRCERGFMLTVIHQLSSK